MDWSEERYVRLYQRDTVTWKRWSWQARCVFPLLLRKVDGAGILDTGTHDVAESMALLVDMPVDICRAALVDLLSSGAAVSSPRGLILPNYLAAQTTASSDRLRQQLSRERRQQAELAEITRPPVTDRHSLSQVVTPSLAKPSLAKPEEESERLKADVQEVLLAVEDAEKHKPPAERLREIWNEAKPAALPPWLKTGPARLKAVRARLAEEPDLEVWRKAIASLAGSPFHLGENDRKWRADPEWLLRPETLTKILERNHAAPTKPATGGAFDGPSLRF